DGRWIVTINGNTAVIHDAGTGAEFRRLRGHTNSLYSGRFSPDGTQLLLSNDDWTVTVWDAAKGVEKFRLGNPGRDGWTNACFNSDGTRILVEQLAGNETIKAITIHNAQTGEVVQTLEANPFSCHSASGSFSPDGKRYVGCYPSTNPSEDGFRVWDVASGRE